MFDDMEFNPIALVMGIIGGMIAVYVTKGVEVNFLIKAMSFGLTAIVCYMMVDRISQN